MRGKTGSQCKGEAGRRARGKPGRGQRSQAKQHVMCVVASNAHIADGGSGGRAGWAGRGTKARSGFRQSGNSADEDVAGKSRDEGARKQHEREDKKVATRILFLAESEVFLSCYQMLRHDDTII